MTETGPNHHRRYRRRIVGWGLAVLVLAFAIPAVVAIRWVHDDLERRVPIALADAGVPGVVASFSGQDGTLFCDVPLADADRAIELAGDVDGVRTIEVDQSCLVGDGDDAISGDGEAAVADATGLAATTAPAVTEAPTTTEASTGTEVPPVTDPVDTETIVEVIAADPQFSQLASLLDQAGVAEEWGESDPLTVLAPTDEAFDATFDEVGADAFQALVSDPELLRTVLLHHVTEGRILSADFVDGPLTMLDGTDVAVDTGEAEGVMFTSAGGVSVVTTDPAQLDIEAANGVLHAVDRLLLPAGVVVEPPAPEATTSVALENGRVTLSGVVSSQEQRDALAARLQTEVAVGNLVDELVVDDAARVADDDVARLSTVGAALPGTIVSGRALLVGSQLEVSGVALDDAGLERLAALADDVDAEVDVTERPGADEAGAQALQDELNEFVRTNPLLFEPDSTDLTEDADAIVEQVAARARRLDGVVITIVGHTDSDGDADRNLLLSEGRALTVLEELVAAGVAADTLSAEGRGETEPVLDADGAEDKVASRRVEFVVEAVA